MHGPCSYIMLIRAMKVKAIKNAFLISNVILIKLGKPRVMFFSIFSTMHNTHYTVSRLKLIFNTVSEYTNSEQKLQSRLCIMQKISIRTNYFFYIREGREDDLDKIYYMHMTHRSIIFAHLLWKTAICNLILENSFYP